MTINPRWACKLSALALLTCFASLALAQSFPSKTVHIVVPFAPGGSADIVARLLARDLTQQWGVPVIVENKSGASGNIGAGAVARAPGDGTTFLLTGDALLVNTVLMKKEKVPYELMNSLLPVSLLANLPIIVAVNSKLPIHSLKDLIDYAHKRPGELNDGTGGIAAMGTITGEMFKHKADVNVTLVPYRSTPEVAMDLGAGRIHFMIDALPIVLPPIQLGTARAIATLSKKRLSMFPLVPTAIESGLDMQISSALALWAPGGTPNSIIERVSQDVATAIRSKAISEILEKQGFEVVGSSPQHMAMQTQQKVDAISKVAEESDLKAE